MRHTGRQSRSWLGVTDIRLLNDMEKARRLSEKPHCVDFRVFDKQVEQPEEQIEV